ncbi:Gfo/Idh/MocA family oxidoreductase [candidate division KSB1 bacterium]|nr:Gfo/Idh/MocA family oxidoreductase [candidate division KSB1 bacterium]
MYKLCIIGASGHWGYVVDSLENLPDVHFSAYAPAYADENVNPFAAMSFFDRKPREYAKYEQMLDDEQPDIVVVNPRYDQIAPISLEATRRGCHVIAEKPLAFDLNTLKQLKNAVDLAGTRLTIMFGIRYQSAFYTAKKVMQGGLIGDPALLYGQKSYRWGANRPEWYKHRKTYGSTINWVGIHALDWARWISGLEYTEIFGYHSTQVHSDYPDCQDNVGLVAKCSNGGTAVFNFDYLRPALAESHGDDRLRIAGSKGVLEVIGNENRLHVIDESGDHQNWQLETPLPYFVDFMREIKGEGKSILSQEDAFKVTEIAIKATQAADSGKAVKL